MLFERYDKKLKEKTAIARKQHSPTDVGNGGKNSRTQAPATGRNRIAQMEREFLFQPDGTEKVHVEYLGRYSVCS